MAEMEIISPGFYTSIQDQGRVGVARYGVPQAGAMDAFSAKKANLLLNNPENAAVLEITFSGPKIKFTHAATICISGAEFHMECNDNLLENDRPYAINAGDQVNFGILKVGFRAYLAISGGIDSAKILGSRSQYKGITPDFRLKKGDILPFLSSEREIGKSSVRIQFGDSGIFEDVIEVSLGPEYDRLSAEQKRILADTQFTLLSSSNRMAIQFKEGVENSLKGITTTATQPGTVQLTPRGGLVVLMRDCQITGGYPRIFQLTEMGINSLSQQVPGQSIFFKMPFK